MILELTASSVLESTSVPNADSSSRIADSETGSSVELPQFFPFVSMLRKSVKAFFTPTLLWGRLLPLLSGDFPPFAGLTPCAGESVGVAKADLYGVLGTGTEYGTEMFL